MKRIHRTKQTVPAAPSVQRKTEVERSVPIGMEIASQWSWRILVVVAVLVVFVYLIRSLSEIVIPFLIALLISALLIPLVNVLERHRWPKWLAIVTSLIVMLVVVGGLALLVTTQIRSGLPHLEKLSVVKYHDFRTFLRTSPLKVTDSQLSTGLDKVVAAIGKDSSSILSGAVAIGSTAGHLLAGGLLTLFATIFMLIDGGGVWNWTVRLFPRRARAAVDGAGKTGWTTLSTFVRVQILVAAADAVGVGLFAYFLGLPLAIPIAVLVFLASFIPVIGAIVTGVLAVFIALFFVGPIQALIMLGGVLLVHLLEAHILQPLVMGGAVRVHPLAVVFAVAGGTYVAGIPGALFAVPTVAVIHVMISYIAGGAWRGSPPAAQVASDMPGTAETEAVRRRSRATEP